jgi:hypothetical protein
MVGEVSEAKISGLSGVEIHISSVAKCTTCKAAVVKRQLGTFLLLNKSSIDSDFSTDCATPRFVTLPIAVYSGFMLSYISEICVFSPKHLPQFPLKFPLSVLISVLCSMGCNSE